MFTILAPTIFSNVLGMSQTGGASLGDTSATLSPTKINSAERNLKEVGLFPHSFIMCLNLSYIMDLGEQFE